jgi:hypothetical protein
MKIIEFIERMVPSNLKTETFYPQNFYDIVRVNLRINKNKEYFFQRRTKADKKISFLLPTLTKKRGKFLGSTLPRLI